MQAEGNRSTYVDWYKGGRRQDWRTPPEIFEPLHAEFAFTLDGASEPGNGLCLLLIFAHDGEPIIPPLPSSSPLV